MYMRRLFIALMGIVTILSSCQTKENKQIVEDPVDVRIGCTNYPSSYAKAALLRTLMTRKGYTSKIIVEEPDQMWSSLEAGKTDVVLSSWLPNIDTSRRTELGTMVRDLGTNCRNMSNGIFVPRYTLIGFMSELGAYGEQFDHKIYVCKESDVTLNETKITLENYNIDYTIETIAYDQLDDILEQATKNKEWVAVALWTPNGNISQFGLRQLRDTMGSYTSQIDTHTLVHESFDRPKIEEILNNYYLRNGELNDLIQVLEDNNHNQQIVGSWLDQNTQIMTRLERGPLQNGISW